MNIRKILAFTTFLVFLSINGLLFAQMSISNLEVKTVVSNEIIVKYSWKMDVSFSEDRSIDCKLKIIFLDAYGSEIHSKTQTVFLSNGTNHLTGHGICKPDVWKKIEEYKAHIKCR